MLTKEEINELNGLAKAGEKIPASDLGKLFDHIREQDAELASLRKAHEGLVGLTTHFSDECESLREQVATEKHFRELEQGDITSLREQAAEHFDHCIELGEKIRFLNDRVRELEK